MLCVRLSVRKLLVPRIQRHRMSAAGIHSVDNCIFCKIVRKETSTNILHEDEQFCVFPDHRPASQHHYLVIPKTHIERVEDLTLKDVDMVKQMLEVGQKVMHDAGGDLENTISGFHWPIHTVNHLHLHLIYPPPQRLIPRIIFSSWFFGSVDQALHMMQKKPDKS